MILDKFKLDGKTALVTGGNKGIGKSYATALAEAGADIISVSYEEDFSEIEEEFSSVNYAYKVGRINVSEFSYEFYRTNPELFISFYDNAEIRESKELIKEFEIKENI